MYLNKPITLLMSALLLAGFALMAQSCSSRAGENPVTDEPLTIRVTKDIPYRSGPGDSWKLDMAIPENFGGEKMPAIVLIHGGGWRAGSKEDPVFQRLLIDYAFQGYVTLSVGYRLDQEAAFPACVEDVKCAVRWLRAHADEFNVDPDRIGTYGHSAGAHLALMLAVVPPSAGMEGDGGWDDYSSMVNAVAAGAPPTEIPHRPAWNRPEWWPVGYISGDTPPMLLLQGSADPIVRVELVDDYVEKLKSAGSTDVEYIRIDGSGHDVAYSQNLDITKPAMDKFFERTLKSR